MRDPSEACERNADCPDVRFACRKCACLTASEPVVFDDASGDLPADLAQWPYLDIRSVTMSIDGPPAERVVVEFGSAIRRPTEVFRACLAIEEGGAELVRLCFSRDPMNTSDVTTGTTSVASEIQPRFVDAGRGLQMDIPESVGIPLHAGTSFWWYTEWGNREADRHPDQGTIPMTDIVGR